MSKKLTVHDLPLDGLVNVAGYDYPLTYKGYLPGKKVRVCVNTGDEKIWVALSRISLYEGSK